MSFSDKYSAKQMAITKVRFGKYLLSDVMKLMGKLLDGRCDFCVANNVEEEEKEDVKHYLVDCMEFMYSGEKVERSIMEERKVVSVETVLGDVCFYGCVVGL